MAEQNALCIVAFSAHIAFERASRLCGYVDAYGRCCTRRKFCCTNCICKGSFSYVNLYDHSSFYCPRKICCTNMAFVRPLTSVSLQMPSQRRLYREASNADSAFVGPLDCVGNKMCLQGEPHGVRFATHHIAFVRLKWFFDMKHLLHISYSYGIYAFHISFRALFFLTSMITLRTIFIVRYGTFCHIT